MAYEAAQQLLSYAATATEVFTIGYIGISFTLFSWKRVNGQPAEAPQPLQPMPLSLPNPEPREAIELTADAIAPRELEFSTRPIDTPTPPGSMRSVENSVPTNAAEPQVSSLPDPGIVSLPERPEPLVPLPSDLPPAMTDGAAPDAMGSEAASLEEEASGTPSKAKANADAAGATTAAPSTEPEPAAATLTSTGPSAAMERYLEEEPAAADAAAGAASSLVTSEPSVSPTDVSADAVEDLDRTASAPIADAERVLAETELEAEEPSD